MARLTQFAYSPCGNSEGMVYSFGSGVIGQLLGHKNVPVRSFTPILTQAGAERRIMIEECIEDLLGYDAPSHEKPYKAYEHILENWGDDFNDLPERWRSIFLVLCSPYLDHLKPAK